MGCRDCKKMLVSVLVVWTVSVLFTKVRKIVKCRRWFADVWPVGRRKVCLVESVAFQEAMILQEAMLLGDYFGRCWCRLRASVSVSLVWTVSCRLSGSEGLVLLRLDGVVGRNDGQQQ